MRIAILDEPKGASLHSSRISELNRGLFLTWTYNDHTGGHNKPVIRAQHTQDADSNTCGGKIMLFWWFTAIEVECQSNFQFNPAGDKEEAVISSNSFAFCITDFCDN